MSERDRNRNRWATGDVSFKTDLPCPRCGQHMVLGYYFLDEAGRHQHTHYVCVFWPSSPNPRGPIAPQCGWHGWTVPGA